MMTLDPIRETVKMLYVDNVIAHEYFWTGCRRMAPDKKKLFPHARNFLPETKRLAARVSVLPTGTTVNERMIMTIAKLLRIFCAA